MALQALLALGVIAAASAQPNSEPVPPTAPVGTETTRYCMRVEPHTGSRIETIECWTREEWALGEVDVDKDWPKEGVRVIEG
ncbi:MAG TPA: hypothetical protein VF079_02370 [Sphingomicrobium sp.]